MSTIIQVVTGPYISTDRTKLQDSDLYNSVDELYDMNIRFEIIEGNIFFYGEHTSRESNSYEVLTINEESIGKAKEMLEKSRIYELISRGLKSLDIEHEILFGSVLKVF